MKNFIKNFDFPAFLYGCLTGLLVFLLFTHIKVLIPEKQAPEVEIINYPSMEIEENIKDDDKSPELDSYYEGEFYYS